MQGVPVLTKAYINRFHCFPVGEERACGRNEKCSSNGYREFLYPDQLMEWHTDGAHCYIEQHPQPGLCHNCIVEQTEAELDALKRGTKVPPFLCVVDAHREYGIEECHMTYFGPILKKK